MNEHREGDPFLEQRIENTETTENTRDAPTARRDKGDPFRKKVDETKGDEYQVPLPEEDTSRDAVKEDRG